MRAVRRPAGGAAVTAAGVPERHPHPHASGQHGHHRGASRGVTRSCGLAAVLICGAAAAVVLLLASGAALRSRVQHAAERAAWLEVDAALAALEANVAASTGGSSSSYSTAGPAAASLRTRLLRVAAGAPPRSESGDEGVLLPQEQREQEAAAATALAELLTTLALLSPGGGAASLPCTRVRGGSSGSAVAGGAPPPLLQQGAAAAALNLSVCAGGCFFAANLHNSFAVGPTWVLQLLATLGALGPSDAAAAYVSVYESGSTDATPRLLGVLRRVLRVLGVRHRVVTGGILSREAGARHRRLGSAGSTLVGDERIAFLVRVRNAALEPLTEAAGSSNSSDDGSGGSASGARTWERLVFVNDVLFCATDVLRLLQYESADVACGMDFIKSPLWLMTEPQRRHVMAAHVAAAWGVPPAWAGGLSRLDFPFWLWKKFYRRRTDLWPWAPLVFYDIWVARDAAGGRFYNAPPYSKDPWTAQRLAQGLPLPAYCCWNGIAVLRAAPFLAGAAASVPGAGGIGGEGPLRFRAHRAGEYGGSECSLLCDDLHARATHRVLIDPGVRLVYDWAAARELYGNWTSRLPDSVRGLPYRPLGGGGAARVAAAWEGEGWLARVAAGARGVESCGIHPEKETVDFTQCERVDRSAGFAGVVPLLSNSSSGSGVGSGGIG